MYIYLLVTVFDSEDPWPDTLALIASTILQTYSSTMIEYRDEGRGVVGEGK